MKPLLRSRPQRIAAVLVIAEAIAIGFLPLFAGPGYEQALATGLLVPSCAAIATALDASRAATTRPYAAALRGVASGVGLALIALGLAFAHGLRAGVCDPLGGVVLFVLGPGIGSTLGGLWGAFVAQVARGRRRRVLLAVVLGAAGPVGCVAFSVYRFWSSPMIFAFDPYVGFFSGSMYDTIIEPAAELLTYRAGSLASVVAALAMARIAEPRPGGGVAFSFERARAPTFLLAAVAAIASLGVAVRGDQLGHFSTPGSVARELGGKKIGKRCDLIHPASMREDEADLLLRDCDEEVVAVEQALGVRGPERITAYFFRDENEKKRLMGAAHTYIAKPWREEVYLQIAGYPHPVLGHEIAHVVAGAAGQGPFRVAGSLGGLWPNPGLIEGIAESASPDDDEISDVVWARAMMDLGILPSLDRIFGLTFFGEASGKAYTIAGAFVGWARDRFGKPAILAWYHGAEPSAVFGQTWAELDKAFRAELAAQRVSPDILATAKARFQRPSVFGRACPHTVDELRRKGDQCRDTGRVGEALAAYSGALAKDPGDHGSRLSAAQLRARREDTARGAADLRAMAADERLPRTVRDRAEEALGDASWLDARWVDAASHYERVAARSLDEDMARTMDVKVIAARTEALRPAVQALLIGERTRGPDALVSGLTLGALHAAQPDDPVVLYLVGRNLVQRARYAEATDLLRRAADGRLPTERLVREALRQEAIATCATGDRAAIDATRGRVAASRAFAAGSGRRAWTLSLLDRCAR